MTSSNTLFLSNLDEITTVLGNSAEFYVPFLNEISPKLFNVSYRFEDVSTFEDKARNGKYSTAKINEVYWRELLRGIV